MEHQLYYVLGWGAPIISALFALFLIKQINGREAGSENMQRIAALIRSGAIAFLKTEYSVLAGYVVVMCFVLAFLVMLFFNRLLNILPWLGQEIKNGICP